MRAALHELRPAVVYHCAGVPHVAQSWTASAKALEGNVIGTHVLLDELRRLGQPVRCLITGSATVYAATDDPVDEDARLAPASPYALSKLAQEALALRTPQEDGIQVVVARAFNHTGPRQDPAFAAPSFARQIALIERGAIEPVIRVGNLEPRRDFTDVRDVVRAYRAADGARRRRPGLQRVLGRGPFDPFRARRAGGAVEQEGGDRVGS